MCLFLLRMSLERVVEPSAHPPGREDPPENDLRPPFLVVQCRQKFRHFNGKAIARTDSKRDGNGGGSEQQGKRVAGGLSILRSESQSFKRRTLQG